MHRLADRVALLTGLVDGLADRVGNLLRHRLIHRLADGVGPLTGLVHRLADGVGDLLGAGLIYRLHHRGALLAGLVHRLADGVGDLLRHRLVDRLADRRSDLPGLGLVAGLHHGGALLAGLIHGLADRVGDLLGDRLVDRLADRRPDLTGLGLVAGLHHRVGNLLHDRLPHRLADGVVDGARTGLPHRLADGVLDVLERLLRLVADAVDLPLLDDLLTDGLVAGVLLLLVHDVLDQPCATARRCSLTARFWGRITTRTRRTRAGEADRCHLRPAVLIAGKTAVRGVGPRDRRHDAGDRQQTGEPGPSHVCRL